MIDIALEISRQALDEIFEAAKALRENVDSEQVIDVLIHAGAHLRIVVAHLEADCPELEAATRGACEAAERISGLLTPL